MCTEIKILKQILNQSDYNLFHGYKKKKKRETKLNLEINILISYKTNSKLQLSQEKFNIFHKALNLATISAVFSSYSYSKTKKKKKTKNKQEKTKAL